MRSAIVLATIFLGLLLLMAGSLWSSLFASTSTWTPEKAQRSAEVKDRLTNLGPLVNGPQYSMHRGNDLGPLKAEFEQLLKENEQLNTEFQAAYDRPNIIAKILKWSGIAFAALGIIGWYAVKNMET